MVKETARRRRLKYAQGLAEGLPQREAALRAGYRECRSLAALASKLAKHADVVAELAAIEREARTHAVAKRRRALEVLTQHLEFSLGPYLVEYEEPLVTLAGPVLVDGQPVMQKKLRIDVAQIKADGQAHLLAGIEIRKDGSIKFSLHDKQGAIDRLAKLKGWNKAEKHEHSGSVKVIEHLTPEELEAEAKRLGIK